MVSWVYGEGLCPLCSGIFKRIFKFSAIIDAVGRAVPGVSLYMTSLTHMRALMTNSPYFVEKSSCAASSATVSGTVLPKLSNHGNLLAGAVTRVGVGFILNPFSVLKARFEVREYNLKSFKPRIRPMNFIRVICTKVNSSTKRSRVLWSRCFAPDQLNFSEASCLLRCEMRRMPEFSWLCMKESNGELVRCWLFRRLCALMCLQLQSTLQIRR